MAVILFDSARYNKRLIEKLKPVPRGVRDDNTLFVIARRTAGRRGNPSCLGGMRTTCLFVYWFTMDRPRLSAPAMRRVS